MPSLHWTMGISEFKRSCGIILESVEEITYETKILTTVWSSPIDFVATHSIAKNLPLPCGSWRTIDFILATPKNSFEPFTEKKRITAFEVYKRFFFSKSCTNFIPTYTKSVVESSLIFGLCWPRISSEGLKKMIAWGAFHGKIFIDFKIILRILIIRKAPINSSTHTCNN